MKNEKELQVLLKVIKRDYNKNLDMKKVIDTSMIEVCAEGGVSPEHVFIILLFLCCCLYHNDYSRKKSKQEC